MKCEKCGYENKEENNYCANCGAKLNSGAKREKKSTEMPLVAVACKMLKVIWFMLTRREPYQSRNTRLYGEKLKRLSR